MLRMVQDIRITFAQLEQEIWAKGFQEGFQEGLEEVRQEMRLEIARRMLQGNFSPETIAQMTGWSIEQLQHFQADQPPA